MRRRELQFVFWVIALTVAAEQTAALHGWAGLLALLLAILCQFQVLRLGWPEEVTVP